MGEVEEALTVPDGMTVENLTVNFTITDRNSFPNSLAPISQGGGSLERPSFGDEPTDANMLKQEIIWLRWKFT